MMFFSTSLNRLASTLIISRATLGWVSIRDSNCQDGRTRHVVSVFAITSAERGYLSSKVISPKNCPLPRFAIVFLPFLTSTSHPRQDRKQRSSPLPLQLPLLP